MAKNEAYFGFSPILFLLIPPLKYVIVERKFRDVVIFAGSRFFIFFVVFLVLKIPLNINFSEPYFLLLLSTFATFIFPIIGKSLLKTRDIVKAGEKAAARLFLFLAFLFLLVLATIVFTEMIFILTNFLLFVLDIIISYIFSRFIYNH